MTLSLISQSPEMNVAYDSTLSKFRTPCTAIVAGQTGSGKTHFLSRLIRFRREMFCPPVDRIVYSYKRYQPIFDRMTGVEFVQGDDYTLDRERATLLILDDQINDISDRMKQIFTVDSHHLNCSVFLVTQNLFMPCKKFRTIALNSQYLMLFKSPRGVAQITHLARQLYTGDQAKRMIRAYADATEHPFTYLMVDLRSDTPDALRFKGAILPDEGASFGDAKLTECYRV